MRKNTVVIPAHSEERYVVRCIASVRNAGIAAVTGDILVIMDCDNRMTRGMLLDRLFHDYNG